VTRATPASHPRVASSRVGPGRRRLALARARSPLGSPNDGAPSGRVATFAAGLLLSRRCVVRLTPDRTRRSPLLRFFFPVQRIPAALCSSGNASLRTIPLRRLASPASFHPDRAGVASSLRFLSPSRRSFPSRIVLVSGTSWRRPAGHSCTVSSVLSTCSVTDPPPGVVAAWPVSCRPSRHADRQRSWGSIGAVCPSQLSSSYNFSVSAGVDLFPGHAPTCR
jgi:hypothetical protein